MQTEKIKYETAITQFLFQKASTQRIPLGGTFELSPVCNFDCRMCYIRRTPEQVRNHSRQMMSLERWMKLADEAKEAGLLYLLLTGGEPFLWPDFWKLYEYLSDKGFILTINSNGSLISEEAVARLKEIPPFRINITLYGASDETYERLCQSPKGFERVNKAIESLIKAGIKVKLNCSLTPYNVCDLEKMVQYARDRNLILEVNTYMFPPLRKNPASIGVNNRFTPKEAARWHLECYRLQKGNKRYLQYLREIGEGMSEPLGMTEGCYDPEDGKILCRAGSSWFWITWDGYMTPCGMLPEPKVDLLENNFMDGWKLLTSETEKVMLSGLCRQCPDFKVCHSCAAMALAETGEFGKSPGYLCEMMKSVREIAAEQIKIYDTK